jgi:hypothetical protein
MKLQNDKIYRDLKVVKEIKTQIDKIMENIGQMHENARNKLAVDRKNCWAQLEENLHLYKDGLKAEEAKQKASHEGQEKDKSNKETLELMSVMAQKIDEDN